MTVATEYQDVYASHNKVLAGLKAALATASGDDAAEIEDKISIYESAVAQLETTGDPVQPPQLGVADLIEAKVYGADGYVWHAEVAYKPGQTCWHNGKEWRALADVAVGHQPDMQFAKDLSSGGWAPVDYQTPEA